MEHLTWHRDLISELVRRFGGWKVLGEGTGVCTLLGPEGPDAIFGSFLYLWASCCFPGRGCEKGYRPYFENYTVDASILQPVFDRLHKMILKIISQFHAKLSGLVSILIQTHVISSL